MLLRGALETTSLLAAEKMVAYTEQRQRMLAENVANIDNPHYRARQLDTEACQAALGRAVQARRQGGAGAPFSIEKTSEFHQDAAGRIVVTPSLAPPENVLFHDDTNARVERQMAQLAENSMMHKVASELLRKEYDGLLKAIRGRIT